MSDIRTDLLERAQCEIDEQINYSGTYDASEAIWNALDSGLIYYRDQWAAIERYCSISDLWDLVGAQVVEAIVDDLARDVEDYGDDKLAEVEEDEDF